MMYDEGDHFPPLPTLRPDFPTMKKALLILLILTAFLLTACAAPTLPESTPAPVNDATAAPTATSAPAVETPPPAPGQTDAINLTILYTDDEHGWMAGKKEGMGAANLVGLWQEKFGYDPADPRFLVLSGGDNWTGPAVSTWFKGESMTEVMNAMGYDASAIGNHEFDFGLDELKARIEQADFPYLAANMLDKNTGQVPGDLGIAPYTILDVDGLHVGIIGLSNVGTPKVTNPAYVKGFEFAPYVATLQKTVPEVREAGADVVLVISHLCNEELRYTSSKTKDLNIALFGGGHCHETLAERPGDAVLLAGGPYFETFAWAKLAIDRNSGDVLDADYGVEANRGGPPDQAIASIVDKWQQEADATLGEPIGYLAKDIPQRSEAMQKLITETWLLGYPNADVAITNMGGMRDSLHAGPVTIADIISVMPFDNVLIDVKLTGAQLKQIIAEQDGRAAIGGMHRKGTCWILNNGEILDKETIYHVLVNDFMYAGGDDYDLLAEADPNAYNTSIDWRQPVIDWIIAQNSTPEHPLDEAIDNLGK